MKESLSKEVYRLHKEAYIAERAYLDALAKYKDVINRFNKKDKSSYTLLRDLDGSIMNDNELFKLLKGVCPELRLSEDKYSGWVCESDISVIELRCNDKEYPTQLLERDKYKALLDDGRAPFYIVWNGNGVLLFDLRNIKFKWEKQSLSDWAKEVTFIQNSEGKEILV